MIGTCDGHPVWGRELIEDRPITCPPLLVEPGPNAPNAIGDRPWPGWCQACGELLEPPSATWCRACGADDIDDD